MLPMGFEVAWFELCKIMLARQQIDGASLDGRDGNSSIPLATLTTATTCT
jgi:hypothetical protein